MENFNDTATFTPDSLEPSKHTLNRESKPKKKRSRKQSRSSKSVAKPIDGQLKIGEAPKNKPQSVTDTTDTVVNIPRTKNQFIQEAQAKVSTEYYNRVKKLKTAREHPYTSRKTVMTNAEKALYNIMFDAFNSRLACIGKSVLIFPMVRMADFIQLDESLDWDKGAFLRIAYKHIDYLVCDRDSFDILFAVELDDEYHNKADKMARDKFVEDTLRMCNIQLFRVNERIKNVTDSSISNIIDYLLEIYAPVCPMCGAQMILKKNRTKKNFGHRFYGCSRWGTKNHCGFNISIE